MILQTNSKDYQRLLKKGDGSILKGLRCIKGGGLGCVAGGVTLLVFAVLLFAAFAALDIIGAGLFFLALFGVPAIPLILIGILLHSKRRKTYLSFYEKETGFTREELAQIDRELSAPDTQIIGYIKDGGPKNHPFVGCFITEHYFVTDGYYIRRLDDLIAAAYTEKWPFLDSVLFGILILSKQDLEVKFITFGASSSRKEALCTEIIEALHERNPKILRDQLLCAGDRDYDLMKESFDILQIAMTGGELKETREEH